jgi:hypothetical protein
MENTGKRCVILLVFIILRWSFNYEPNVFRYNKILIDCVFGNSKFVVPSTLTIHLGLASVNSQCLVDNKLAIPSYPVNKYILYVYLLPGHFRVIIICLPITRRLQSKYLYNNIVLSMLYAEICPNVRRHNARPGRGVHYAF